MYDIYIYIYMYVYILRGYLHYCIFFFTSLSFLLLAFGTFFFSFYFSPPFFPFAFLAFAFLVFVFRACLSRSGRAAVSNGSPSDRAWDLAEHNARKASRGAVTHYNFYSMVTDPMTTCSCCEWSVLLHCAAQAWEDLFRARRGRAARERTALVWLASGAPLGCVGCSACSLHGPWLEGRVL